MKRIRTLKIAKPGIKRFRSLTLFKVVTVIYTKKTTERILAENKILNIED